MINYKRRVKSEWMHDCIYIDQLNDGEIGYTIGWCFVKLEDGSIVIPRDEFCSHGSRGTHDVKIKRSGDLIEVLTNNYDPITEPWRLEKVKSGQPTFTVKFVDNG